ncbi:MAG: biotin synthase BioB [Planctomycetota bacterium]|jgi:biotin synthase|nr:biotin synthase BioB [Planctomycetota bacterium]MDP6761235.1 biotin synthase BioB [Planctomycetota bacterium]MDP6988375.1 biotin synthase BioB [Planctomycetota bacterium]
MPAEATTAASALAEARRLLDRPLLELVFEAAGVHRQHHDPARIQRSQLVSIKTGGCAEDCGYCSQSAHSQTGLERQPMMEVGAVLAAARAAKESGADRFCMGAAWREVSEGEDFERVLEMVRGVKALGLEACVTLGMLEPDQAQRLQEAGLDFYNHNLDTGRSFYDRVVTTREYDDRLRTIEAVREAGVRVCTGGILGLGEDRGARAELLAELAGLDPPPESVPINTLVGVEGTPLGDTPPLDWAEVVRTVAATRILLPHSTVRLSAGRGEMSEQTQALCFLAGANSIFSGEELLTTPNAEPGRDEALLAKLGLHGVGA